MHIYIYIYIIYLELPLYNGGAYHQGRNSGASIVYKTIMYNKFIAYSLYNTKDSILNICHLRVHITYMYVLSIKYLKI
jgi:hypothetical protein